MQYPQAAAAVGAYIMGSVPMNKKSEESRWVSIFDFFREMIPLGFLFRFPTLATYTGSLTCRSYFSRTDLCMKFMLQMVMAGK